MQSRIFRQISLERLSSPEQLDHIIRITDSRRWAGLLGILFLLMLGMAWAFEGSLPTAYSGSGMIIGQGGITNVLSEGEGQVLSLDVSAGQHVKPKQIVAQIAQPDQLEEIGSQREELEQSRRDEDRALKRRREQLVLETEALRIEKAGIRQRIDFCKEELKLATEEAAEVQRSREKGSAGTPQIMAAAGKIVAIKTGIAESEAKLKQFDAQEHQLRSQVEERYEQSRTRIDELQRKLTLAQKHLRSVQAVAAPYGGEVVELKAYAGAPVNPGSPILSLQREGGLLEAVVYIPAAQAKDVRPGMEAQVSPSNVRRDEYGYIKGTVTFVADFPATPSALMRNFQNETFVATLSRSGLVTELHVALNPDKTSANGFGWSSSKGPPVTISSGTICGVVVVTGRRKPLSFLLPALKGKVGLS
jgi:HlyD family secretion protein